MIDLFDRKVIGWQVSNNLTAKDTVIPALNKACSNRTLAAGQSVIFHLERGIQYIEILKYISKERKGSFKNEVKSIEPQIESLTQKLTTLQDKWLDEKISDNDFH